MDSSEFSEWIAYYSLEPFGAEPVDQQLAVITSVLANQNRAKKGRSYKPEEFKTWGHIKPTDEPESLFGRIKTVLGLRR